MGFTGQLFFSGGTTFVPPCEGWWVTEVHDLHIYWARIRCSGRLFVGKLWLGAETTDCVKKPRRKTRHTGMIPEVSVKWLLNGCSMGYIPIIFPIYPKCTTEGSVRRLQRFPDILDRHVVCHYLDSEHPGLSRNWCMERMNINEHWSTDNADITGVFL